MRRDLHSTTSSQFCQDFSKTFSKVFFEFVSSLKATLLLYHNRSLLSSGFANFFKKLFSASLRSGLYPPLAPAALILYHCLYGLSTPFLNFFHFVSVCLFYTVQLASFCASCHLSHCPLVKRFLSCYNRGNSPKGATFLGTHRILASNAFRRNRQPNPEKAHPQPSFRQIHSPH